MNRRLVRAIIRQHLALALVLSCMASGAWASGTLCIDNVADLALALDDAQGTATTIQLVRGSYDLSTTVWDEHHSPLAKFRSGSSLLGGYGTGCSSRNIASGNTVLTSTGLAEVDVLGDALFEGLTFNLVAGFYIQTNGFADGSEITIRRNTVSGAVSNRGISALDVDWKTSASGTIRFVDNLVHDNSAKNNANDNGAVEVDTDAGAPKVELINNTIVDNAGGFKGFSLRTTNGTALYAYNNIFYGNSDLDLFVQAGSKTVLVDNDIGTYFFPNPNTPAVGTLRGDPQLDANFRPIESPASPVINVGTDDVIGGLPATDLSGRDREIGSEPDFGAYESSVSDSLIQTVTNANDSGVGSLRTAIEGANANGASGAIILFNIGTTCVPSVIHLQTALPSTTAETHIIGFTQPGSSANTLDNGDNSNICVILDGDTNQIADGFAVAAGADDSASLSVNGIAFSGFTHSALNLRGGVGHYVNGIRTGGSVNGVNLVGVSYGIILGPGVHGATIGSTSDDGARNVLGGVDNNAIQIDLPSGATPAAHDNQVLGNYIGVSYVGTASHNNANGVGGISVRGYSNTIQGNVLGFNTAQAIHVSGADAHDNTITKNLIGSDFNGTALANGVGILIDTGASDNDLSNNFIEDNTGTGVSILDTSDHDSLVGTVFSGNGGLAIDLGGDGVTANDNDSQEVNQPNRKQNFPLIQSAIGEDFKGTIAGYVVTTPGDYTIQIFASQACDASGYGQGDTLVGMGTATVSGNILVQGQAPGDFSIPVVGFFTAGFTHITATATDSNGNTSEFSQCFDYTDDQIFGNGFEQGLF
jgi:hypothetical protein